MKTQSHYNLPNNRLANVFFSGSKFFDPFTCNKTIGCMISKHKNVIPRFAYAHLVFPLKYMYSKEH